MKLLLLIAAFSISTLAQTNLPDKGTLDDLKGKTKIYIVADADHSKPIEKDLVKSFPLVGRAADADFFIEYKTLSTRTLPPSGMSLETGEMTAYILADNRKILAWSASKTDGAFNGAAASKLVRQFIKDWKKHFKQ